MLLVHAGIEPQVQLDLGAQERVARQVAAREARRVGEAVRKAGLGRKQQEVRGPRVACGDHEDARFERERFVGSLQVGGLGAHDHAARVVEHEPAHQGLIEQRDLLRFEEAAEGEIRRVARARGADLAGVAPLADRPAVVLLGVLGLGRAPEGDPALLGPGLERLQVVGERHGRHGVGRGATILGARARLAGDPKGALSFDVVAFEVVPAERPVHGEAVERAQAQVFLGEAVGHSAPVQRGAAHRHGARDHALRLLVADEVARPGVFAVVEPAPAVLHAVLEVADLLPRLHHGDGQAGPPFRQLLGEERGRNPAADDADVALQAPHQRPSSRGGGAFSEPGRPRQMSRPIAAP